MPETVKNVPEPLTGSPDMPKWRFTIHGGFFEISDELNVSNTIAGKVTELAGRKIAAIYDIKTSEQLQRSMPMAIVRGLYKLEANLLQLGVHDLFVKFANVKTVEFFLRSRFQFFAESETRGDNKLLEAVLRIDTIGAPAPSLVSRQEYLDQLQEKPGRSRLDKSIILYKKI